MLTSETIIRRLLALPKDRGVKISSNKKHAWMVCQWHYRVGTQRETTPSFIINLTRKGKHAPGTGHCFACSKHLNKFEAILDPTKEDLDTSLGEDLDDYAVQLYNPTVDALLMDEEETGIILPNPIPWNPYEDWRSVRGKLLHKINAQLIFEEEYNKLMAYLPCVVNGNHIGGIKANLEKQGKRNYFNLPGEWVYERGLFPYDYTRKFIKHHKLNTVVPVEGPRDALRSLQQGIPAVAILGCGNWSDNKAELIASLGVDNLITGFDGDEAGRRVTAKVYESLKSEMNIKRFNFGKYGEDVDPGNASPKIMRKLRSLIV